MRDVKIKKVMNGFTVQVGCQTLVFETQERMMGEIEKYLKNPQETEEMYLKTFGMSDGQPPEPPYNDCSSGLPSTSTAAGCGPSAPRR